MTAGPNDKLRAALGFAMKAGKVRSGEFAAERSVKSGRARIAVLDSGASENTRNKWCDMCINAGIPLVFAEDVGSAIGRDSHMTACVEDDGFAGMILRSRSDNEL